MGVYDGDGVDGILIKVLWMKFNQSYDNRRAGIPPACSVYCETV